MQAFLDYISVTLNERFTWHDWIEYANQPQIDEQSGVVSSIRVPKSSYKTDRIYKHIVLSCWGKDSIELAYLALHHNLEPTRLDVKFDIPLGEDTDEQAYQEELVENVKGALRAKKSKRRHSYHVSPGRAEGESRTDFFGSRASDCQIRIYRRNSSHVNVPLLRVEFQLRGELAKSAWLVLSKGFFKDSRFHDVLASLEAQILIPGTLGIDWENETIYELDRTKMKVNSSRKDWVINQVIPALIKEFNETGDNLAELIKQEFDLHFFNQMQASIDFEQEEIGQYRKARLQHFKDILNE